MVAHRKDRKGSPATRGPNATPKGPPVGNSFADDDDETIVYSSRVPSDFSADDDESDSTTRDHPNGPPARHGDFSDVDDEATYLLPEGAAQSLASTERATPMRSGSGRAQALSEDGQPIVSNAPRIGDDDDEEDTMNMAVPPELLAGKPRPRPKPPQHGHRPSLVDEVTPPPVKNVRSLASLPGPELDVHDYTMSSPNIVRMSFQPSKQGKAPANEDRRATIADSQDFATSTMGSEDAHLLGQLTVDAPEDATVYVDGVERGKGRVHVNELDRFTHYIVRVHRPGHRPWSTSITLDGQVETSVVPELIPR